MSKLDDLILAAKVAVENRETVDVQVMLGESVAEFRFTKLDAMEWRNLCAKYAPRDGVVRDMNLGYNYDLAPSGYPVAAIRLVDGDELVEVSVEQWAGVLAALESPDLFNVSTALWGMHEWGPREKAKKALAAKSSRSRKK